MILQATAHKCDTSSPEPYSYSTPISNSTSAYDYDREMGLSSTQSDYSNPESIPKWHPLYF